MDGTFSTLKETLLTKHGYTAGDFVDFTYAPDIYEEPGRISPSPYTCDESGGELSASGDSLRLLIRNVHASFPNDRIVLVGHSLGGMVITQALEGLGSDEDAANAIAAAVTINSPLYGASSKDIDNLYDFLVWLGVCPASGILTQGAAALQLVTELKNHENQREAGNQSPADLRLADSLGRFHDQGARIGPSAICTTACTTISPAERC